MALMAVLLCVSNVMASTSCFWKKNRTPTIPKIMIMKISSITVKPFFI